MGKTRWWCFTKFNGLDFDYQALIESGDVTYIAYGPEVCPTTGRKHHQGWMYRASPSDSVKGTAKLLNKAHVEQMFGRIDQNDEYCSKQTQGVLVEFGVKPKQGERNDLKTWASLVTNGEVTVDQMAVEEPQAYHQWGRTLAKVEDVALRRKARTWMTEGTWIWGPTGTGKSKAAFADYEPSTHYVFKNDGGWWDGYTGQETVIVDDFRGEIRFGELLRLVDRWPMEVRRRNREPAPFLAKRVIITSSMRPEDVYSGIHRGDSLGQMERRFTVLKMEQKCPGGNTGPPEIGLPEIYRVVT